MLTKKRLQKLLPLLITLGVFLLFFILSRLIPRETLKQIIKDAGPLGPFIYIILVLFTYIVAPISGTPLFIVGFYVFGKIVVLFLTIAVILSAITNFWIARIWGRKFVAKLVGEESLKKIDEMTDNYGLLTLFFLRVFLSGLHDLISYAAGLTDLAFWPYFIITIVGSIPARLLEYYLASKTSNPVLLTVIVFAELSFFSAIFFVGSLLVKKYKEKSS